MKLSNYWKKNKLFAGLSVGTQILMGMSIVVVPFILELMSKIAIDNKTDLIIPAITLISGWSVLSFLLRFALLSSRRVFLFRYNMLLKHDMLKSIINRSYSDFRKNDSSYYVSLFNNDMKFIEENRTIPIFALIGEISTILPAFIYAMTINIYVTLLIIAMAFITMYIPKLMAEKLNRLNNADMESMNNLNKNIMDAVSGYYSLKRNNAGKHFLTRFKNLLFPLEKNHSMAVYGRGLTASMINGLSFMVQFILFIAVMLFIVYGGLDKTYFLVFLSLMNVLITPIYSMAGLASQIKASTAIKEKIEYELNVPSFHSSKEDLFDDKKNLCIFYAGSVSFQNISFGFDEDRYLFNEWSQEFKAGHKYILKGKSGSGKSSLIKLLFKDLELNSGNITVNGKDISAYEPEKLNSLIAVVPPEPMIFRASIADNICLFKDCNRDKVKQAIEMSGLSDRLNNLCDGPDTLIGEGGIELSSGEKQRIELARAFYRGFSVLILDEATANLDRDTALSIEKHLTENKEFTLINITHKNEPDFEDMYDHIIEIGNL